ncbi:Hsp20 family protein [Nocardioides humilatus]|uniref:Heat shock protein 1 n=4 Tax=cellular organisms TaxID=131567 RepID=Q1HPN2_BOMMO|nr:heat shock protein 1 [Bombyx mori]XP_021205992.1 heat shock protein 1 isoform X1 [Bombyx mori]KAA1414348.1 Hsp20 family protein [Nocardioides humilatus]KAA1415379.1 Hsp20 family protein [Nocardioides antri]KAA2241274.1 Hsp20 family protein [Solihabitans fulvus]WJN79831.1 heat shock protein [Bombyx mandarina]ABF51459.1 heat shock protein 1 [Bombyx mori]
MSIVPMMFRDWWDDWERIERPSRLLDQHFGMGLKKDDLLSSISSFPSTSLFRNSYFRPWRASLARQESSSTINLTKEKFEVILDVQQFTPDEITVKASNNTVVVEGKHEEKQDEHGFISRQFTRRYILPTGYEVNDLVSTLSSDGVLTVTAPKRPPPNAGERIVPITKTGPAKQPEAASSKPEQQQPREQMVPIVTSP